MNDTIYKPGEVCPISGQYGIVDDQGKTIGKERTMVKGKRFPPSRKGSGYVLVDATQSEMPKSKYRHHIGWLIAYYMVVLFFSFWLLLYTWGSQFTLMKLVGLDSKALEDPLIRTIGFTIVGGILGSLLYHIRVLYYFYAQRKNYDPDWLGKYITAPWEGAGMALVVLSLIRGGVAVFGGSMGTDVTGASNFAAFGTGALVGFGMRDVVGWIGSLIQTMFTFEKTGRENVLTKSPLLEKDGKESGNETK